MSGKKVMENNAFVANVARIVDKQFSGLYVPEFGLSGLKRLFCSRVDPLTQLEQNLPKLSNAVSNTLFHFSEGFRDIDDCILEAARATFSAASEAAEDWNTFLGLMFAVFASIAALFTVLAGLNLSSKEFSVIILAVGSAIVTCVIAKRRDELSRAKFLAKAAKECLDCWAKIRPPSKTEVLIPTLDA